MRGVWEVCCLAITLLVASQAFGQTNPPIQPSDSSDRYVYIDNIFIVGNKKTKSRIIQRELSLEIGERYRYSDLPAIMESDRNKIYNTKLFNVVDVGMLDLDYNKVDIVVKVEERWYLFPIPHLDIVDRNFNDWVQNHGADLSRIIYGLDLYHFNMRGMNERMTVNAQFGYTKTFGFDYSIPYIDKNQRNGLSWLAKYSQNTNLHYDNIENKREFLDSETVLKEQYEANVSYLRRNSFYTRHQIDVGFKHINVADTIITLNPNYFATSGTRQRYFNVAYTFTHDKRDIAAYPLKGYRVRAQVFKKGIGIFDDADLLSFSLSYGRYDDLGKGFYLSNYTSGYVSTPSQQAYSLVEGLGFGNNNVRGYELYVIHGQHYAVNKTTIKKQLLKGVTKWKAMPLEQFQTFPYAFYLKAYFDMGYSKNTEMYEGNQPLADKLIFGTGVGLDIVTFYDFIIRLEYSMNRELEHGFFLHLASEF